MVGGIGYGSTQVSSAFSTQHGGGNSSTVSNTALVPGLTPNQVKFVIIEIDINFSPNHFIFLIFPYLPRTAVANATGTKLGSAAAVVKTSSNLFIFSIK